MTARGDESVIQLDAPAAFGDTPRMSRGGRLAWRDALDAAALPPPIPDLIARVVRGCRLWRTERADLARELAAHFADGLEAGRSPEDLVRQFGEAGPASRLIRRAKKRNRPRAWRALVRASQITGGFMLALLLAYAILAIRFFITEPTITRNYAAEYNRTIEQIPEEDRAWNLYLKTYAMLDPVPDPLLDVWPAPAPEHPLYAEALAYLEEQRDVIELARRAASLPRLGATLRDQLDPRIVAADNAHHPDTNIEPEPPSENPMLAGVLLPELAHMRNLAKLLAFDAHVAAGTGDAERAARSIHTMLGVARHAGDRPLLISGLVEIAIYHLAGATAAQIIHARPDFFTSEQLRGFAQRFAAAGEFDLRHAMQGERWAFKDMVQRVYSDDGQGNGHLTYEGLRNLHTFNSLSGSSTEAEFGTAALGPLAAALVADRATLVQKHEELMAKVESRARLPMWEYDSTPRVTDEVERMLGDPMQRFQYLPLLIVMPALDRAAEQGEYVAQWRDGLLTGVALELYRRDTGDYPATLDELTPRYLPEIPPDRYTGEPLNYAVVDGQPRLWSVGVDREDDGGAITAANRAEVYHWLPREAVAARIADPASGDLYEGDWVVWPVEYKPLTSEP